MRRINRRRPIFVLRQLVRIGARFSRPLSRMAGRDPVVVDAASCLRNALQFAISRFIANKTRHDGGHFWFLRRAQADPAAVLENWALRLRYSGVGENGMPATVKPSLVWRTRKLGAKCRRVSGFRAELVKRIPTASDRRRHPVGSLISRAYQWLRFFLDANLGVRHCKSRWKFDRQQR